jgi:hypothetical protein
MFFCCCFFVRMKICRVVSASSNNLFPATYNLSFQNIPLKKYFLIIFFSITHNDNAYWVMTTALQCIKNLTP